MSELIGSTQEMGVININPGVMTGPVRVESLTQNTEYISGHLMSLGFISSVEGLGRITRLDWLCHSKVV